MTAERKARLGRLVTTVLLLLLLATLAVQTLLESLPPGAMAFMLAVKLLPLAVFLPALRRGGTQTALWFSMFLMPYFCWAVLGAFAPGSEGRIALLVALLISACFSAALLMLRWQRALALTQTP